MSVAPFTSVTGRRAPAPVFCAIADAYRRRAVADAIVAGRFAHAGVELDLGLPPDWFDARLPADEEWAIEWRKFYGGLDLAAAYRETGDGDYLHAFERLVESFLDQCAPDGDSTDVAARRVQNWIYAWQRFGGADDFQGLSDGLGERLVGAIAAHVAYIRADLTPERNHRTLELYALLIAGLALPEIDRDGDLVEFALTELDRNFVADFRPDGVHREASPDYHMIVLRSFVGAIANARMATIAVPAGIEAGIHRALDFALHVTRPDGVTPALSDGDAVDYRSLLEFAGGLLGRDDLRYVAARGLTGTPPARRHVSFPDGGYHLQRSGFGEHRQFVDERYLVFDCGPLGDGGHGHYDQLSVEIAANGRPLVVDPGRYTYAEQEPVGRRWFKGTAAHNTVVVDGLDQVPYRRGKPKGALSVAEFLGRIAAPRVETMVGRVTSPCYPAVHTRRVLFVDDDCWVIDDDLASDRFHRYDLRFHLPAEAEGRIVVEPRPNGALVTVAGLVAIAIDGTDDVVIEPGHVSDTYGVRHDAPVVSARRCGVRASFASLIQPLLPGQAPPTFHVARGSSLTVARVGGRSVSWTPDPGWAPRIEGGRS